METDQLAALAGKWQYTAQCTLQALAIYSYLTRIVGWNHRVVVRVATVNEAAFQYAVTKLNLSSACIKLDDSLIILAQNVLQQ